MPCPCGGSAHERAILVVICKPTTHRAHLVATNVCEIVLGVVIRWSLIAVVPLQPSCTGSRKGLHLALVGGACAVPHATPAALHSRAGPLAPSSSRNSSNCSHTTAAGRGERPDSGPSPSLTTFFGDYPRRAFSAIPVKFNIHFRDRIHHKSRCLPFSEFESLVDEMRQAAS